MGFIVVGEHCDFPSSWRNNQTLFAWMRKENVAGIQRIDTRQLTKQIREKGTILGKIVYSLPVSENDQGTHHIQPKWYAQDLCSRLRFEIQSN
ncbi:carbamoyl phosphate synthase small chain-like [Leptinotarsa decemlineata]|uniref:carbamoyl phosphate synthase small chain-like n=1 Tax=Leptinotarsa decemlineata TaxID=7539 RepID=UPI003D30CB54